MFEQICRMTQKELKEYVTKQLTKTHKNVVASDGYVYAQGKFPVLLVAHMDTVHKEAPYEFIYNSRQKSYSSPQGIGGDDRCGIYMIFEIIKQYNCSVLFCEDEEIGCVGAQKFIETELARSLEFNYIIELDRQGRNDAVFYDCDNPEFEEFITKEYYETAIGSFTDISYLAPYIGCAAVNLSCGYYKAHTDNEYVVISEMHKSIEAACKILERTTAEDKFEYIEADYGRYNYKSSYSYWDSYDYGDNADYDYEGRFYYLIEYADPDGKTQWCDITANSDAEAIGKFCMKYPNSTFNDIIDMCAEDAYC